MTERRPLSLVEDAPRRSALISWRCPACGALLAKVRLTKGSVIQTKCKRCGALVIKEAA